MNRRGGASRRGGRAPKVTGGGQPGLIKVVLLQSEIDVLDMRKLIRTLGVLVEGEIKSRTHKGIGIDDRPLPPYSAAYKRQLKKGGENSQRVDLTVTGGLVNSVKSTEPRTLKTGGSLLIQPGTGNSPEVRFEGGVARRTGKRGPPHRIVGTWLHEGTGKMRARPWLGISPEGAKRVVVALTRRIDRLFRKDRRGGQ